MPNFFSKFFEKKNKSEKIVISQEMKLKEKLKDISKVHKDEALLLIECTDEQILYKAFYQVKEHALQEIIVEKLEFFDYLKEIALSERNSYEIRIKALEKLNSQKVLEEILEEYQNNLYRYSEREILAFALKNLKREDEEFWVNVIIEDKYSSSNDVKILEICFENIKSQENLMKIIKETKRKTQNSYLNNTQITNYKYKLAIKKISDENMLFEILKMKLVDSVVREIMMQTKSYRTLVYIYDYYYSLSDEAIERLKELGHEKSLAKIIKKSSDKTLIDNCISSLNSKESLYMLAENAEYWYTMELAKRRIKELNLF